MKCSLLFSFLLVTSLSFAQQIDKSTRKLVVQNDDLMIEASALVGEQKITISNDITYHWFRNNEIHETKGGYEGDIMHGDYTSFYASRELKEKGAFNKGVKHGMWKSWHENGEIHEIVTWRNGLKTGAYMQYTSTGVLVLQSTFRNGLLHGKMVSYREGKILNESFYENGVEIPKAEKPIEGKKKRKKIKIPKKKKDKIKKTKTEPPKPEEKKVEPQTPEKS